MAYRSNSEKEYLELVSKILSRGNKREDRTGTGTISLFGEQLKFDMAEGFPLLTTKKVHFKSVWEELMWFISGDTYVPNLQARGVRIWNEWTKEDGTIGPGYSASWRAIPATPPYKYQEYHYKSVPGKVRTNNHIPEVQLTSEEETVLFKLFKSIHRSHPWIDPRWVKWEGFRSTIAKVPGYHQFMKGSSHALETTYYGLVPGPDASLFVPKSLPVHTLTLKPFNEMLLPKLYIDQLKEVIDGIVNTPDSRRLIVNAWHVPLIEDMALPPCHMLFQFYCRDNYLDLRLDQRSADVFLGLPFNIASYAALLHLVAAKTGRTPGVLTIQIGDAHIYLNHLKQVKEQLSRDPYPLPSLRVQVGSSLESSKYVLDNYQHHPTIKASVAV